MKDAEIKEIRIDLFCQIGERDEEIKILEEKLGVAQEEIERLETKIETMELASYFNNEN